MKLIQLRYLVAVAENDLNITQAARVLHAAQPGVSKQLKLLEDELGFQLFERKGRALVRPTDAGNKVIDRASQIVRQARSIKALASELRKDEAGSLSIATTHTQARYVLPQILKRFRDKYPKVRLHLHQGNSEQIADLAATDRIHRHGREPDVRRPGATALLSLASRHRRARRASAGRDQ